MIESYAELHCHSFYSLLDGASSPEALVTQAVALGMQSLALTDHDSMAGAVRFWKAAQRNNIHPIFGTEVALTDGSHLTLLAETQVGYANLCRLISQARLAQLSQDDDQPWTGKLSPRLNWTQVADHAQGLIALSGCRHGPLASPLLQNDMVTAKGMLAQLQHCFGPKQLYIELQQHGSPTDQARNTALIALATQQQLSLVVTNNVHYASPDGARLRDVLIATDHNCTLQAARQKGLLPNSSRYVLTSPRKWRSSGRPFHKPCKLRLKLPNVARSHWISPSNDCPLSRFQLIIQTSFRISTSFVTTNCPIATQIFFPKCCNNSLVSWP